MILQQVWRPMKECPRCEGEGWLWAHELSEYPGEATGCPDDTRYACDHHIHLWNDVPGTRHTDMEHPKAERIAVSVTDGVRNNDV